MAETTIRAAARDFSERYGKSTETWRRQFHKWLSGETEPNEESAARLGAYFGKPEGYFMAEPLLDADGAAVLREVRGQVEALAVALRRLERTLSRG